MNMIKKQYNLAKQSVIFEITTEISNLGMTPITGSLPAEKIVDLVENKLSDFNLSMKRHIIASVTNEAFAMKKFGWLSGIEYQLCYAHGLHLVKLILDVKT